MSLTALLCWFDEPPDDLIRCVTSLGRAGVTHLVAVDGPYEAFPHTQVASHPAEHAALRTACWSIGIGLTLHIPDVAWDGNEIAKRTFMHRLAYTVTGPDAWHLVIDADEVIDTAPANVAVKLYEQWFIGGMDVASVMCREHGGGGGLRRRLFRSQPIHLEKRHCIYVADSGTVLVDDNSDVGKECPALELPGFVMNHRRGLRGQDRLDAKVAYYRELPEGGHLLCENGCGREANQRVRVGFRVMDGELFSDPLDVCQFCAELARTSAAAAVQALGFSPDRAMLG